MENFEYSILRNDRDWAEFDLDSDECSLIPPALATAEDQVLSDPEEEEAKDNRLIGVRVSPLLAHEAVKGLSHGAPDTHLLAEDIGSVMEEEVSLASVNNGIDSQAGAVSTEVLFPTSIESSVVSENAEQPTYCPPEGLGVFQAVSVREATAFQKKPSTLQERPVPAGNAVASSHLPSKSRGESPPVKLCRGTEKTLDLKDKKGDEGAQDVRCHLVQERGQADYERFSASVQAEHPFLAGREGDVHLNATQGVDSGCDEALDTHRERVVSAEISEKSHGGEPCRHFEMEVPVDVETCPAITGGRRPELVGPSILCGLTLDDSPERSFTNLTSPEMYDYFFCDDTKEEGGETRRDGFSVPCMDSELPNLYGPEMYEYFFNEMDIEKAGHKDRASTGTSIGRDHQSTLQGGLEDSSSKVAADAMHISTPEVYEHFFTDGAKDRRNWRGFLLRLTAAEAKKAARALKSFLSRPVRRLQSQPTSHGELLRRSSQGRLVLLSRGILDERLEIGETAIMQPERPLAVQPVLTHRDMCLGFVAFASWAVKTSDLQAPDAWKIMLLANFGTLSAIRYFRRQVVTEGWYDTKSDI